MYRSTFDILSRYISNANQSQVVFDKDGMGGTTDMDTGVIHLPEKIGDKNVFAVLALLMHESAHVCYSKKPMKHIIRKDEIDQHIFNVIEDYRIDRKNYNKLPNVRAFYEKLVKGYCDQSENTDPVPLPVKVLLNSLYMCEGYYDCLFPGQDIEDFIIKHKITNLIQQGAGEINRSYWDEANDTIQEIRKILNQAAKQDPNQQQQKLGKGVGVKVIVGKGMLDELGDLLHPASLFSDTGTILKGASSSVAGEIALEEQTIQQFKELLNITERKVIEDGTMIDTDNLMAYFLEDLEELFVDDSYIKRKKSKIMFLLDASGSMGDNLLDGVCRYKAVAKCTNTLTRVLKELQDIEGINVDWCIAEFEENGCKMLDKNTWENNYGPGGGTNLSFAFEQALDIMNRDFTIEGKKIIIVLTDGDVGTTQIEEMKKMIIHHNSDIKSLIIGVGTDPTGPMALNILGDNLILAEENANLVLLETIKSLI